MTTDSVVKILAVVGGGAVGGLSLGLLIQLAARAFTTKKLPPWPILTVRLLGGLICGWLVALWLFGGGGPGIGGMGGFGFGSGAGKGKGEGENEKKSAVIHKEDENTKHEGEAAPPADATLRIEVLGQDALKRADKDARRCYRIESGKEARLMTLDEVKESVRQRQEKEPPLRRIEIVLYNDSPEQRVPLVQSLRTWASELNGGKMKVDISQVDGDAPRK